MTAPPLEYLLVSLADAVIEFFGDLHSSRELARDLFSKGFDSRALLADLLLIGGLGAAGDRFSASPPRDTMRRTPGTPGADARRRDLGDPPQRTRAPRATG